MAQYTVSKQTACYLDLLKRFQELVSDLSTAAIAQYDSGQVDEKIKPAIDAAELFEDAILEMVKGSIAENVSIKEFKQI